MKAEGCQRDQDRRCPGQKEDPNADMYPIRIVLKPGIHDPPGRGEGNSASDQYKSDELLGEQSGYVNYTGT